MPNQALEDPSLSSAAESKLQPPSPSFPMVSATLRRPHPAVMCGPWQKTCNLLPMVRPPQQRKERKKLSCFMHLDSAWNQGLQHLLSYDQQRFPPSGPNRSPEAEFRELNSTGGGETVCPVPSQLARRLKPEMALIGNSPGFRQGTIKVWVAMWQRYLELFRNGNFAWLHADGIVVTPLALGRRKWDDLLSDIRSPQLKDSWECWGGGAPGQGPRGAASG